MLNCPFCNIKPALIKRGGKTVERGKTKRIITYQYKCLRCNAETPFKYTTPIDAEKAWDFHADCKCFDILPSYDTRETLNYDYMNLDWRLS